MAISKDILLNLEQHEQSKQPEMRMIASTLGIGHSSNYEHLIYYTLPKPGKEGELRSNLAAVFGQAAYDKVRGRLKVFDAARRYRFVLAKARDDEHAIATAVDPEAYVGRMVEQKFRTGNGDEYRYSLKELFPSLKPRQQGEVKAELEKLGFAFDGNKIINNKHFKFRVL